MIFHKVSRLNMTLGLFIALCLPSPAMSQAGSPISGDLHAVPYAESGNWWDTTRPGEGLVLERQGNTVAMILFTYTLNGEPDFYLATAPLTISLSAGDPPPVVGSAASFFIADGTLFRFKNGPVLNSDRRYFEGDPPANETEPVGKINAAIRPLTNTLHVRITLDEDKVPEGSERITTRNYHKSSFGYAGFGKYVDDENTEPPQATRPCWVDLRGRWVFVDNSNPATRDVWSFNFTELETSPAPQDMTCQDSWHSIQADHLLLYRDPDAGATLRCVTRSNDPLYNPNFQPGDRRCVLRTGEGEGEPLLWFSVKDIGAKQIIATPGAPPSDYKLWRGWHRDGRVTGLRLD